MPLEPAPEERPGKASSSSRIYFLGGAAAVFMYALSLGPVDYTLIRLHVSSTHTASQVLEVIYWPMRLLLKAPAIGSTYESYLHWWRELAVTHEHQAEDARGVPEIVP